MALKSHKNQVHKGHTRQKALGSIAELNQHKKAAQVEQAAIQNVSGLFEEPKENRTNAKKDIIGICSKTYGSEKALNCNKNQVHDVKCDLCQRAFRCLKSMNRHKQDSHTNEVHKCDLCPKAFASLKALNSHKKATHRPPEVNAAPEAIKSLEKVSCPYCTEAFGSAKAMKGHKKEVHKVKCDLCLRAYWTLAELNRHKQVVHGGLVCGFCNAAFENENYLYAHLACYHFCGLCHKKFKDAKTIRSHMLAAHIPMRQKAKESVPARLSRQNSGLSAKGPQMHKRIRDVQVLHEVKMDVEIKQEVETEEKLASIAAEENEATAIQKVTGLFEDPIENLADPLEGYDIINEVQIEQEIETEEKSNSIAADEDITTAIQKAPGLFEESIENPSDPLKGHEIKLDDQIKQEVKTEADNQEFLSEMKTGVEVKTEAAAVDYYTIIKLPSGKRLFLMK